MRSLTCRDVLPGQSASDYPVTTLEAAARGVGVSRQKLCCGVPRWFRTQKPPRSVELPGARTDLYD